MSSVILVGCAGGGSAGRGEGACIARTRRFESMLRKHGCEVELIDASAGSDCGRRLGERLRSPGASAVIAISPYPAESAVRAGTGLPMWIDMNGMHPAEVQLDTDCDQGTRRVRMARILSLETALLTRGDRFSTPSGRQRLAVMAELLLLGRMDTGECTVPVFSIPHCISDDPASGHSWRPAARREHEGFRVLSAGSFNKWFDHVTLFRAMELAMEADPGVTFTAAGGAIPHSPGSHDEFAGMVSRSRFADRFELLGWLDQDRLEEVYARTDLALYMDLPCAESDLGARTRVLDWISRGIPVACTRGAEISEVVEREGMGAVVPQGDAGAMAGAVLAISRDPSARDAIRGRQEAWSRGAGSCDTVFRPLLEWVDRPVRMTARPLARPPVPPLDSLSYRILLIREILGHQGPAAALRRILRGLRRINGG